MSRGRKSSGATIFRSKICYRQAESQSDAYPGRSRALMRLGGGGGPENEVMVVGSPSRSVTPRHFQLAHTLDEPSGPLSLDQSSEVSVVAVDEANSIDENVVDGRTTDCADSSAAIATSPSDYHLATRSPGWESDANGVTAVVVRRPVLLAFEREATIRRRSKMFPVHQCTGPIEYLRVGSQLAARVPLG